MKVRIQYRAVARVPPHEFRACGPLSIVTWLCAILATSGICPVSVVAACVCLVLRGLAGCGSIPSVWHRLRQA